MPLYYVGFNGRCGLQEATNIQAMRKRIVREEGTANGPYTVRPATREDVAHVKGMGGYVPSGYPKLGTE